MNDGPARVLANRLSRFAEHNSTYADYMTKQAQKHTNTAEEARAASQAWEELAGAVASGVTVNWDALQAVMDRQALANSVFGGERPSAEEILTCLRPDILAAGRDALT